VVIMVVFAPVRISLESRGEFMSTQMMQATQTLQKEVKAEKRISLTKIMVLTDFSEVSDLALQYALALARRYQRHQGGPPYRILGPSATA
jgi:hypothetical protein